MSGHRFRFTSVFTRFSLCMPLPLASVPCSKPTASNRETVQRAVQESWLTGAPVEVKHVTGTYPTNFATPTLHCEENIGKHDKTCQSAHRKQIIRPCHVTKENLLTSKLPGSNPLPFAVNCCRWLIRGWFRNHTHPDHHHDEDDHL